MRLISFVFAILLVLCAAGIVLAPIAIAVPNFIDAMETSRIARVGLSQNVIYHPYMSGSRAILLFGGAFLCMILLISLLIMLIRSLRGEKHPKVLTEEESQMLRQIWEGQDRMEERITHLETILLERHR